MIRDKLLEMAELDAFGLLEPDEQREFEVAVRNASDVLQSEVRGVQETVLGFDPLLPDHRAPETLRRRVLRALGELIERDLTESVARAPIARLGPGIGFHGLIERLIGGRVSPLWRVACLVFATVAVGLGWFATDAFNTWRTTTAQLESNQIDQIFIDGFGRYFLAADATMTTLQGVRSNFEASGSIFYLKDSGNGAMFFYAFPESGDYKYELFVRPEGAAEDEAVSLASFTVRGGHARITFEADRFDPEHAEWWVMASAADGTGEAMRVLTS